MPRPQILTKGQSKREGSDLRPPKRDCRKRRRRFLLVPLESRSRFTHRTVMVVLLGKLDRVGDVSTFGKPIGPGLRYSARTLTKLSELTEGWVHQGLVARACKESVGTTEWTPLLVKKHVEICNDSLRCRVGIALSRWRLRQGSGCTFGVLASNSLVPGNPPWSPAKRALFSSSERVGAFL